jgi:hypothetical protein
VFLLGPLSLYPQVALRDAGSDSNISNDSTEAKSDLTYTLTPRLYAIVPIGNTRFVGTGVGDLVYYRVHEDQRSITMMVEGRYEAMSPGLRPFVAAAYVIRGEREGFEIDARARHTQSIVSLGFDLDISPYTALTAWANRSETAYDRNFQYLDVYLAEELDQRRDTVAAGMRFRVTPLTTVVFAPEVQRYRFVYATIKDADSLRIAPTVQIDTGGAITGDASAGFRSFVPRNHTVPAYRGFVGTARLHYTLLSLTRFDLEANRDIGYSYNPLQPYYLESGARLAVTQRLLGPLEVIGIGERRQLRNQRIGGLSFDGRHEVTTSFGGGVGIPIQDQMRFTLIYEHTQRVSSEPIGRNYERHRVLGSIIYGL